MMKGSKLETVNKNLSNEIKLKSNKVKKRVTFKKASELVSIREISPRPNRTPESTDNGALSSSDSSSDSDSDCSTSTDTSSDDDEVDFANKISKLVLRHTRSMDKSNKSAKTRGASRVIPPRPVRLRRPLPQPNNRRKLPLRNSNNNVSNEAQKSKSLSQLSLTNNSHSIPRIAHRAQSSTDIRDKTKIRPSSPRSKSATSLTLTSRLAAAGSTMYGSLTTVSQNDRNSHQANKNNTNSGQERTKFYAWQIANGAPLVTTPGIAPLYSEQTTLTKL